MRVKLMRLIFNNLLEFITSQINGLAFIVATVGLCSNSNDVQIVTELLLQPSLTID